MSEVDFKRRIELEKASKFGFPEIVDPSSESMIPSTDGEVIFELIFDLIRLLWNVDVSTKPNAGWESEGGSLLLTVDEIVPILITKRKCVHRVAGQTRV